MGVGGVSLVVGGKWLMGEELEIWERCHWDFRRLATGGGPRFTKGVKREPTPCADNLANYWMAMPRSVRSSPVKRWRLVSALR